MSSILPYGKAWLIVDLLDFSIEADLATAISPLNILKNEQDFLSDASSCMGQVPFVNPLTICSQFFFFDFSDNFIQNEYIWNLELKSLSQKPLPFFQLIIASNNSCPDATELNSTRLTHALDPKIPGNSPEIITIHDVSHNTKFKKWWIKLVVPNSALGGPFPFSIRVYLGNSVPDNPIYSIPLNHTNPWILPIENPSPPEKKPIPVWGVAIIAVSCIFIAAGSLFYVARISKRTNEFEII